MIVVLRGASKASCMANSPAFASPYLVLRATATCHDRPGIGNQAPDRKADYETREVVDNVRTLAGAIEDDRLALDGLDGERQEDGARDERRLVPRARNQRHGHAERDEQQDVLRRVVV